MPEDHKSQPRRRFSALLCSERTRETPKQAPAACTGAKRRFVCTSVDRRRRSRCSPVMEDVPGGEFSLDQVVDDDRLDAAAAAAGAAQSATTAVTPALSLLLHRGSSGGGGWRMSSSLLATRAPALGQHSLKKRACSAGTAWTTQAAPPASAMAWPGLSPAAVANTSPLLTLVSARHFSTDAKAPEPKASSEPWRFDDGVHVPLKSASILARPQRDPGARSSDAHRSEHRSWPEQFAAATLETQAHRVYGSGSGGATEVPAARPHALFAPAHKHGHGAGGSEEEKILSLLAEVEEAQAKQGRVGMAASVPMAPSPRAMQGSFSPSSPLSNAVGATANIAAAAAHPKVCVPELVTEPASHSAADFLVLNFRRLQPHYVQANGTAGSVPTVAEPAGPEHATTAGKISAGVPIDSARSWPQRRVFIQRLNTLAKVYHPSMPSDALPAGLLFDSEADLQIFRSIDSFAISALEAAGDACPRLRSQWRSALSLPLDTPLSLSAACLAHRVAKTVVGTLPGTALLETRLPIATLRARTRSLRSCLLHGDDDDDDDDDGDDGGGAGGRRRQRAVTLCRCSGSEGVRWVRSSRPLAPIAVCHDDAVSAAGNLDGCVQVLPVVWRDRVGHLEPTLSSMLDVYCYPELFAITPILGSMGLRHSLLVMGVRKFVHCHLDEGVVCLAGDGDDAALERPQVGRFLFTNIPHVSDENVRSTLLAVLGQFHACLVAARKANLRRASYRLEAPRPGARASDNELHCLLLWIAASALDQQLLAFCCDQQSADLLAGIAHAAHRKRLTIKGMTNIAVRTYLENKHAPVFSRVLSLLEGLVS